MLPLYVVTIVELLDSLKDLGRTWKILENLGKLWMLWEILGIDFG